MSTKIRLKTTLETIARRGIPEDTNVWPQIAARIEKKDVQIMNMRTRFAWITIVILLGLLLTTGIAYAIRRYFSTPGLQYVEEAGMVTELNVTAQPTMHTQTPEEEEPTIQMEMEQEVNGVSVTLDRVILNESYQMLGFSVRGLPEGLSVGMPHLDFGAFNPDYSRGAGLQLRADGDVISGDYIIYQIVRKPDYDGTDLGSTAISVDIPVLDEARQPVGNFHFDVPETPVRANPIIMGNTYAIKANGVELRLEWISLDPQETRARLCADGQNWGVRSATLQIAGAEGDVINAPALQSQPASPVGAGGADACTEVVFPASGQDAGVLRLTVSQLAAGDGQTRDGAWIFNWGMLPDRITSDALPSGPPVPTAEIPRVIQTANGMTATLIKAYADAEQLAFVLQIDGLPEGYAPFRSTIRDAEGNEINAGQSMNFSKLEPGIFNVSFSPRAGIQGERFVGQMIAELSRSIDPAGEPLATFAFDLDLPVYQELTLKPQQVVAANGIEIRLDTIKITPSLTQIYLCFQKPGPGDWGIGMTSILQIGDGQAEGGGSSVLFDDAIGTIKGSDPDWEIPVTGGRCILVEYPIGHHNRAETLKLTINDLEQSPPEAIPDDQVQMAREKLRREGIEMDWVQVSGPGGGGSGPVITQRPEGMDDLAIIHRFYEVLGYDYPGPWEFEVPITP
ncbi:MAG: hypothetical protein JXA21_27095 [Anaerolineae bacterium]|nr:hypothetical protein [Anaerolineae bacterium]